MAHWVKVLAKQAWQLTSNPPETCKQERMHSTNVLGPPHVHHATQAADPTKSTLQNLKIKKNYALQTLEFGNNVPILVP